MANDFRETRDMPGQRAELFTAALEATARCNWKVKQSDAHTGIVSARTSWVSTRGGGERIEVRVADGRITCDSRSWSKLAFTDLGKNRANVGRFFDALVDQRAGRPTASPLDRMRSLTEHVTDRLTERRSNWAPPSTGETQFAAPPTPAVAAPRPQTTTPQTTTPLRQDSVVVHDIRFAEPVVETVSLDEIPVDNSSGKTELAIETEVRYTLRAGVSIDEARSVGGELGAGAAKFLTGKICLEGSRSRSVSTQEEITKSYKATFRAAPGENVVYRITWKRRAYPGEIEFTDGTLVQNLPFQLVADLEYAVSTHLADG